MLLIPFLPLLAPVLSPFDVELSVERIETPFQLSSASLESDDLELLFLLQNLSLGYYLLPLLSCILVDYYFLDSSHRA